MRRITLLIALFLAPGSVTEASLLYGLGQKPGDPSQANVYTIDPLTGAATLQTTVSVLASNPGLSFLDDSLYASNIWTGALSLGTIDLNTGDFTTISFQGISDWKGQAANEAAGLLYTIDENQRLKSITPTGVITPIGFGTQIDGDGMAYDDKNGILYATGRHGETELYAVDIDTGLSTLIGDMGISSFQIGLAYDEKNEVLYANQLDYPNQAGRLYRVDVTTGLATEIGPNGVDNIHGLAWVDTAAIPEPSSFFTFGGALGMGLIGLWWRRRRKAA